MVQKQRNDITSLGLNVFVISFPVLSLQVIKKPYTDKQIVSHFRVIQKRNLKTKMLSN